MVLTRRSIFEFSLHKSSASTIEKLRINLITNILIILAKWPMMKRSIVIGSLSGPNFAIFAILNLFRVIYGSEFWFKLCEVAWMCLRIVMGVNGWTRNAGSKYDCNIMLSINIFFNTKITWLSGGDNEDTYTF